MKIGVPKEIKNNENRVGLTPAGAASLIKAGHTVTIEHTAGTSAGYADAQYEAVGAQLVDADTAWQADLVIKVKEPLASEYHYFRSGLILYTYLHLAANKPLTEALMAAGVTAIGYETMVGPANDLPALAPMSQVAGRMAVLFGAQYLQTQNGGKGVLLTAVPGVAKANVVIIGGGVVGLNAAKTALGLGANVTVLDINSHTLARIDDQFGGQVQTLFSNEANLAATIKPADLVIGAVLIPGAVAPKLVSEQMIASMTPGSVVVDIPIDQGGIFATSDHATTFDDPIYLKHGVIHYAVANVPGAVPKTATDALTAVTTPLAVKLATQGLTQAAQTDHMLYTGVNIYAGQLVEPAVGTSLNLAYEDLAKLL